jgi:hypothetical protein
MVTATARELPIVCLAAAFFDRRKLQKLRAIEESGAGPSG